MPRSCSSAGSSALSTPWKRSTSWRQYSRKIVARSSSFDEMMVEGPVTTPASSAMSLTRDVW